VNPVARYDYVIVGAGSAGCVLAARLTEDPACRVLLLEAGGEGDAAAIQTPALYAQLQDSPCDWGDRTTPQPGLGGRRIFMPQGRALGGSSAINYMIYIRGHPADYDGWCAAGNPGWSYRDVLPYFRRSERNLHFDDHYHGRAGPLAVSSHPAGHPLVARYFAAAAELGIPYNPDFNGASQDGCGPLQATIAAGVRCSAARGYLDPARSRPNLTVLTHAHATRLLFSGTRATGVEYLRLGQVEQAAAAAEVILAAGALRSPQLLLLSGVGPAAELEQLGVAVRHDLPGVGKNLQDHLHTRVRCAITEPLTLPPLPESAKAECLREYAAQGTGPFASNFLEAGAFLKSRPEAAVPDLQHFFLMLLASDYPEAGPPVRHGITLTSYINRPRSRGEVRLASSDPLDRPVIDPGYLSEADDLRCAVSGVRWNLRFLYARAFDDIRGEEVAPGKDAHSDADLADFVRRSASTTWHPTSTCAMGSGPAAVVDPALRVHGLDALRVADASIMPNIVGGNTHAPVVMIAEKAADVIRGLAPRADSVSG
jgi:choline dehydrogenase